MLNPTLRKRILAAVAILLGFLGVLVYYLAHTPKDSPTFSPSIPQQITTLSEYVGRDLESAKQEELWPLLNALRALDSERDKSIRELRKHLGHESRSLEEFELFVCPHPRYLWSYSQQNAPNGWLLLDRDAMRSHPGSTDIRLTAFDNAGSVLARLDFTTGWRCYLNDGRLESIPGFPEQVVVLRTVEGLISETSQQFYARFGTRFDVVRLEHEGTAIRNGFWLNHGRRGPLPPSQSAEQWEADLISNDRPRVLRALVWLGGHHLLPLKPTQKWEAQMEDLQEANLSREVRARPKVIARLTELSKSADSWEREGALLALKPEDVRWF